MHLDDRGCRRLDNMGGLEVDSAMRQSKILRATLAGEALPVHEVAHRTKLSRASDGWEAEARLMCRLVSQAGQHTLEVGGRPHAE